MVVYWLIKHFIFNWNQFIYQWEYFALSFSLWDTAAPFFSYYRSSLRMLNPIASHRSCRMPTLAFLCQISYSISPLYGSPPCPFLVKLADLSIVFLNGFYIRKYFTNKWEHVICKWKHCNFKWNILPRNDRVLPTHEFSTLWNYFTNKWKHFVF